ncbi:MAG: hypothetical protein BJ554DRAFT_1017 [Olpidium bornovanus]|uniref:Uncharacterized protein n=1 Tax=Olpidium bornovanus TaxID=278681 RepID=A0A8H7ZSX2_9FUNG|nr:MAG: hypothetical protein BJ554DRAFT_1017 [Olpidium bornovanus]
MLCIVSAPQTLTGAPRTWPPLPTSRRSRQNSTLPQSGEAENLPLADKATEMRMWNPERGAIPGQPPFTNPRATFPPPLRSVPNMQGKRVFGRSFAIASLPVRRIQRHTICARFSADFKDRAKLAAVTPSASGPDRTGHFHQRRTRSSQLDVVGPRGIVVGAVPTAAGKRGSAPVAEHVDVSRASAAAVVRRPRAAARRRRGRASARGKTRDDGVWRPDAPPAREGCRVSSGTVRGPMKTRRAFFFPRATAQGRASYPGGGRGGNLTPPLSLPPPALCDSFTAKRYLLAGGFFFGRYVFLIAQMRQRGAV